MRAPLEGWGALDQRTDRIQEEIIEVREMKNENLTVIKNDDAHTDFGMLDKVFQYGDRKISVEISEEGDPLFLASDLCAALGYSNPWDALRRHVDEMDLVKHEALTKGGKQKVNFVTEAGMFALIFGSKLDGAVQFKRWVCSEVLPAIRKRGMYLSKEKEKQLRALESAVKALESKVSSLQSSKRKSSKKRDPMLKVTTGTYKQFDIFEKTYCEFADQKQIRKSSMSNTEGLLWKVQHMSRSAAGMISGIADICQQLGCKDEKTLRFLSEVSEKMKALKDTITKSELRPLLTEVRDGGSKKVLNLSQKLSGTPAYD